MADTDEPDGQMTGSERALRAREKAPREGMEVEDEYSYFFPFSKDAWFLVLIGVFTLTMIALVPFSLLTHKPAATWGFFCGMVAGIFIILSALAFARLLRSAEEWEKVRRESAPWSGEIIERGPVRPPAAAVFEDKKTTDRLMLAFSDPGFVVHRAMHVGDPPDVESLSEWQRRAVEKTITDIWGGL